MNPARSLGPALIVGHTALSQIWVFLLAPLAGGALAAVLYRYLIINDTPLDAQDDPDVTEDREIGRVSGTP